PAVTTGICKVLSEMRSVGEQFFRHTADVHAGPTEVEFLGHRDPGTKTGGHPAGTHSTGACADDKKIKIVIRHACCPAIITSRKHTRLTALRQGIGEIDIRYPPAPLPRAASRRWFSP